MQRKNASLRLGLAFFLIFGLLASFLAYAQQKDTREADRAAIRKILVAQQTAWNQGNLETFVVGYWQSPELTFSGSDGVQRGYDGVLARYKKSYPDKAAMGQLDFSDLEFHFLGKEVALVLGRWHLKREKDELGGTFTLVWQRFPDGWKIVHDHTSLGSEFTKK